MQFDIVINWCSDKGNDNSQIKDRTTSQESQEFHLRGSSKYFESFLSAGRSQTQTWTDDGRLVAEQ